MVVTATGAGALATHGPASCCIRNPCLASCGRNARCETWSVRSVQNERPYLTRPHLGRRSTGLCASGRTSANRTTAVTTTSLTSESLGLVGAGLDALAWASVQECSVRSTVTEAGCSLSPSTRMTTEAASSGTPAVKYQSPRKRLPVPPTERTRSGYVVPALSLNETRTSVSAHRVHRAVALVSPPTPTAQGSRGTRDLRLGDRQAVRRV